MNIIFFTQEDPFYVKIFFDEFFAHYRFLDEIKAVVISRPMGKKSLLDLAKQMYGLYGLLNFLRIGSKFVFYKLMSKRQVSQSAQSAQSAQSVDWTPKTYSLNQLCDVYGVPAINRSDINSEPFIKMIKSHDPDLFISVASPVIFKQELIKTPKIDCINIHNAPLPNYRGMLPNFWQLYHHEKNAGITVHKIDVGIDTGDIIEQIFVPVAEDESLDHLIKKTKSRGASLIINLIEKYKKNEVTYTKMIGEGSYFTFPSAKDSKEFKKRGHTLL